MGNGRVAAVWGVFVGEQGDQLEAFNSKSGPFPPEPGTVGHIAIGWASVGNMNMYRDDYADYVAKFRTIYPNENERVLKTQANMPWNFAFAMKSGDWVLCPSSSAGYLLIGRVTGEYLSDFDNPVSVAKSKTRADLLHLRQVEWQYAIERNDPRHEQLHRIGQLTVVQPNLTEAKLMAILGEQHSTV